MKPKEERYRAASTTKPTPRFLAGFGIGLIFGWFMAILRKPQPSDREASSERFSPDFEICDPSHPFSPVDAPAPIAPLPESITPAEQKAEFQEQTCPLPPLKEAVESTDAPNESGQYIAPPNPMVATPASPTRAVINERPGAKASFGDSNAGVGKDAHEVAEPTRPITPASAASLPESTPLREQQLFPHNEISSQQVFHVVIESPCDFGAEFGEIGVHINTLDGMPPSSFSTSHRVDDEDVNAPISDSNSAIEKGVSEEAEYLQAVSIDTAPSDGSLLPDADYSERGAQQEATEASPAALEATGAANPLQTVDASKGGIQPALMIEPSIAVPPIPITPLQIRQESTDASVAKSSPDRDSGPPNDFDRRSPSLATYRPRPSEEPKEYFSAIADHLPPGYLEWNRWITEHSISSIRSGAEVYLCITPTILAGVAAAYDEFFPSAQEAEEDFTTAVAAGYAVISSHDGRLRTLRRIGENGHPLCVAFLAASVLAAYRMHSDDDAYGGAYYYRLADLLNCGMTGNHPQGFDPAVFESLWIYLRTWLGERTGAHLAMPGSEAGIRRFVGLPLLHVPLRRLDIERLPTFFIWAGYAAGAREPESKLASNIDRWIRSYASLSSAGAAALADERRHAVVSQVAQELMAWDGSGTESGGRRSASVELVLDIVAYRPDLSYLPRRPSGFPARFDDGLRAFDAADEGWYEQIPFSAEAGSELANGFEWRSALDGNVGFRRPPATVVPLAPHPDYSGFLSRFSLLRGACCAVLCRDTAERVTADYLSEVTGRKCTPLSHSNIPLGWKLFTNIRPKKRADIPEGLEALDLDTQVSVICSGGLRIGRRREWLLGAPPKIAVTGLEDGDVITLNGEVVLLGEDGSLQTTGHLLRPGLHSIEAAGHRSTFEIVQPQISRSVSLPRPNSSRCVTLPQGHWTILGAVPGEISTPILAGPRGTICRTDFDPVWAICVGSGPGAIVASIKTTLPAPDKVMKTKSGGRASQRWASSIYDAAVRRADFNSLLPTAQSDQIKSAWIEYLRVAKQIKRQWRNKR